MSKYVRQGISADALNEIAHLATLLDGGTGNLSFIHIDHVQIRTGPGDDSIIGKLQYENGTFRFKAKKDKKNATP